MSNEMINKNIGHATAYAYAVEGGYVGTEEEFAELLGNIAEDLSEIENLSVTVTTLPAGSSATASYSHGVLSLGIPKGDKGDKGDTGATGPTGNGISSITKTETAGSVDTYTITYTNGTTSTFNVTNGEVTEATLAGIIAAEYDSTKTYAVGDFCLHSGALYECTTAITTAEAWNSAHWALTNVGEQIEELKENVDGMQTALEYALIRGINRLDPSTMQINKVISNNTNVSYGEAVDDTNYDSSDFIEVSGGDTVRYYQHINTSTTTISETSMFRIAEYDENKTVITVSSNWARSPYTTGLTTKYVRISFAQRTGNKEIVLNGTEGSTITYTQFNDHYSYVFVDNTKEQITDLVKVSEASSDISDLLGYTVSGVNKLNPETASENYTISNSASTLGELVESSGYLASDYITAKKGDAVSYYHNSDMTANWAVVGIFFRVAEYDKDKNCLLVSSNWPSTPYIVSNTNTAYVRISVNRVLSTSLIMITVNCPNLSSMSYAPYDGRKQLTNIERITPDIELVLPSKIPCVINMPLYVYNRAISYGYNDYNDLLFSYNNYKQGYWKDRIKITKTAEGTSSQVVNVFDEKSNILKNNSFDVVAINNANHGEKSAKVLIIGDSKTEARYKGDKLKELIDADSNLTITFLGTQTSGAIANEGYSGKSIVDLCRTASFGTGRPNIFYNSGISATNKFDFAQGVSTIGDTPDIVFIDMGANDWNLSWEDVKGCYDSVISSIHAYNSDVQIVISIQEGVSEHLLSNNTDNDHALLSQFVGKSTSQKLIAEYDSREDENIFILPQYVAVDPMLDFPICELPVSEVNPMRIPMCVDHVHPGINTAVWDATTSYPLYAWIRRNDGNDIYGYGCVKGNTGVDPLTDDGTYWVKCENANAGYYKIAYMYYYMLWYLLAFLDLN